MMYVTKEESEGEQIVRSIFARYRAWSALKCLYDMYASASTTSVLLRHGHVVSREARKGRCALHRPRSLDDVASRQQV